MSLNLTNLGSFSVTSYICLEDNSLLALISLPQRFPVQTHLLFLKPLQAELSLDSTCWFHYRSSEDGQLPPPQGSSFPFMGEGLSIYQLTPRVQLLLLPFPLWVYSSTLQHPHTNWASPLFLKVLFLCFCILVLSFFKKEYFLCLDTMRTEM